MYSVLEEICHPRLSHQITKKSDRNIAGYEAEQPISIMVKYPPKKMA
jgi:hypothetical protein